MYFYYVYAFVCPLDTIQHTFLNKRQYQATIKRIITVYK